MRTWNRCFNEAAGIHRRKRLRRAGAQRGADGFNEAAGIHRRKPTGGSGTPNPVFLASMRPPEFTGGNHRKYTIPVVASTSFNEAAGIHRRKPCTRRRVATFTLSGFNEAAGIHRRKQIRSTRSSSNPRISFNEAAGIHRRKPAAAAPQPDPDATASMRPPEFTGGNAPRESKPPPPGSALQ